MNLEPLISAMNAQLSAEYQAVMTYNHYSAVVTGPHRPELVAFFRAEIPDELRHAQYLADKVAALGGTPAPTALPVPVATETKALLKNVLEAESQAVEAYKKLMDLADEAGETGIRLQMETFLQDETNHRDEVSKILHGAW